jgi:CRISPR-associated protein Csd2
MYENAINNRYDFIMLYDVENGNPNGDPDAGNMPRIDPETGHGIVTDVCIKRKIRNYVDMIKEGEKGFNIYIRQNAILNHNDLVAGEALGIKQELEKIQKSEKTAAKKEGAALKKAHLNIDIRLRDSMCQHFYDIRAFGAVMTTFVKGALNCGQVRGPIQIAFGRSVDPIFSRDISITRVAITTEEDALKKDNEMGRKHIVPYALYKQEGFISANLARQTTGFNDADLELLWDSIQNMFEFDRSAARGKMTLRELIIFRHESALGNAPSQKLFDLVKISRKEGVSVPRAYSDYNIAVEDVPSGIKCERRCI